MLSWIWYFCKIAIAGLAAYFTIVYFVLPWVLSLALGRFGLTGRATRLSLLSGKGVEARAKDRAESIVPDYRLERYGIRWGGCQGEEGGLVVWRCEGVTIRLPDAKRRMNKEERQKAVDGWIKAQVKAYATNSGKSFVIWLSQIVITYIPPLAKALSLQLVDIRVIHDGMEGMEYLIKEINIGLDILFEGKEDAVLPAPINVTPTIPQSEFKRNHPLESSPPPSPTVYTTFSNPFGQGTISSPVSPSDEDHTLNLARQARDCRRERRATLQYSKASNSAGQFWRRIIGRATGAVTISVAVSDIAVILPHDSAPPPSARPSIADLKSESEALRHRRSRTSFHRQSRTSIHSIRQSNPDIRSSHISAFGDREDRPKWLRYLPSEGEGYETLIQSCGTSRLRVGIGFSPKKGLWGEDTVKLSFDIDDVSCTLSAVDKIQDLLKGFKEKQTRLQPPPEKPVEQDWEPTSSKRKSSLIHYLSNPASEHASPASSADDLSIGNETYTVSLDFDNLFLKLSAADASTNDRAKNAFGTNNRSSSRVRGVGIALSWNDISISCIAPGDQDTDKNQLFAIRQGDLEGLSTWRPTGWGREELLFANDPNIALVVVRGGIASVDIAADLPLLRDLQTAWETSRPASPTTTAPPSEGKVKAKGLLPRIRMVMDVGPISIILGDRIDQQRATISVANEGCHLSFFTQYEELAARRRNLGDQKQAFGAEAALLDRRMTAGGDYDPLAPPSSLRPQYRRTFVREKATLEDDLAIRMKFDANCEIEPTSVHLSLTEPDSSNQKTYHVAAVGKIHGKVGGGISGRTTTDDGVEQTQLVKETFTSDIDFGVAEGIKFSLSQANVINTLISMGKEHQKSAHPAPSKSSSVNNILDKLPSGISARLSLGLLSVFVARKDPNPSCELQLNRGLWLQTSAVFEYAYYTNRSQCLFDRTGTARSAQRAALGLPEDITNQAAAFHNQLRNDKGKAALFACTFTDCYVKPIYNGERFNNAGGVGLKHEPDSLPESRKGPAFTGWNFGKQSNNERIQSGEFANNVPPFAYSDVDQAKRAMFRNSEIKLNILLKRDNPDARTGLKITSRMRRPIIVLDMSHMYCALIAALAIRQIASAWKPLIVQHADGVSDHVVSPQTLYDLSVNVKIPAIAIQVAFPLHEQIIIDIGGVDFNKIPASGLLCTADRVLLYVPSVLEVGVWEELGRIKAFQLKAPLDKSAAIEVDGDLFRLRIPSQYVLAKLILNINVTIKSLKRLISNFHLDNFDGMDIKSGAFEHSHKPGPESAKRVPHITLGLKRLLLEATDDPLDTKLNLIFRAGLVEQVRRIEIEDVFEAKIRLMAQPEGMSSDESLESEQNGRKVAKLTRQATVSCEDARVRLDLFHGQAWSRRIRSAQAERRRRESDRTRHTHISSAEGQLPIKIAPHRTCPPLFRVNLEDVKFDISPLTWSYDEIVDYMGKQSSPFKPGTEFALLVPVQLDWKMAAASISLRDYPLPIMSIQRTGRPDIASWNFETPFIIAEEYHGPETWFSVPTEILPAGVGHQDASALHLEVFKTISPVKTYTRPMINIRTERTTEFTWGNSYQPAIQDLTKVIDTISHPPKDTSEKPGFWDKFRLNLHWKIQIDFVGPVHLHLKGSSDPYAIKGHGAGFALAWREKTRFRVGYDNPQWETIQIEAQELMVVIPDLSALNDGAAIGNEYPDSDAPRGSIDSSREEELIRRRYTKPCARFLGGVRVGFGFRLERTCRRWSCKKGCGSTEKLAKRLCRFFEFKDHQDVLLRNPEAIERAEQELGHPSDSFEGFRSDFIHFSVSLVLAKSERSDSAPSDPSSLHFSPKAFAHFYAWWRLFNSIMSLPIRQGKMFPNSPPPSKKFGRSIGTMKYRFDLADVYLSHVYSQIAPELWNAGKSQYLGVKAHFGRFRADLHQRRQDRIVRHDKLGRTQVLPHKPFYAVDVLLDKVVAKGVVAEFVEAPAQNGHIPQLEDIEATMFPVRELPEAAQKWYNFFDYIDADRKPLDHDPLFRVIDLGDCPQVSLSKRVKAYLVQPKDDEDSELAGRFDKETTKFGHEKSHICYLGEAPGVGPMQTQVAVARIAQLQSEQDALRMDQPKGKLSEKALRSRLKSLHKHVEELSITERREISDQTIIKPDDVQPKDSTDFFENQLHVHCPKILVNNTSRNLLYRYWYSSQDRKREEYQTSFASLRSVRQGIARRLNNEFSSTEEGSGSTSSSAAMDMVTELVTLLRTNTNSRLFRLPTDLESTDGVKRLAKIGLPVESVLKAKNNFLFLKPQIALRSEVDDSSIVLLAVEEILFRGYDVRDKQASDAVSASIMTRNYMFLKGLQAFYPTDEVMRKERSADGIPFDLDFLPLEIFLDSKNEATDYDRIVWKADAAISIDKFNHLRLPRGMDYPVAKDDFGMPIEHLRIHQDLFNVVVPRLTVSATSKHYTALYNIVTDLLMYQDPRHRNRSERIDTFILAFDRKDRNPAQLILDLFQHQRSIQKLNELLIGYEANVDLLNDDGKMELFKIRNDLLELTEQLFTVFEAIAVNAKRDDARASLVQSSRINVQAGGIAWHMLRNDFSPLVQLDIDGTLFSYIANKDGSTDNALLINDLSALNSNADAIFTEVITRAESNSAGKKERGQPFAWAAWSLLAPVGGIPIVRESRFFLHYVRVCLEERVARQLSGYVFADRGKSSDKHDKHEKNGLPRLEVNGRPDLIRTSSNTDLVPLTRSKSSTSIVSQNTGTSRSVSGPMPPASAKGDEKYTMVPSEDAKIMRQRASLTRMFHRIEVATTSISLSYKSDDSRKHSGWTLPDCVDIKVRTPMLQYNNRMWSYQDIFEAVKKDFRSHAWSQSGDLFSQILKKTSLFRSKKALKQLSTSQRDLPARILAAPSRLRYNIDAPTPSDVISADQENVLSRVISRRSSRSTTEPTSPVARIVSLGKESAPVIASPVMESPVGEEEETISSSESSEEEVKVGKVKGFLGRLGRKKEQREMSTDDLRIHSPHEKRSRTSSASLSPHAQGYHSST